LNPKIEIAIVITGIGQQVEEYGNVSEVGRSKS
jgi:hypothetical protein